MMLGGISHAEQVEEYDLTKSGNVQSVGVNLLNTAVPSKTFVLISHQNFYAFDNF
jgi:hypothetical protein